MNKLSKGRNLGATMLGVINFESESHAQMGSYSMVHHISTTRLPTCLVVVTALHFHALPICVFIFEAGNDAKKWGLGRQRRELVSNSGES